MTQWLQRWRMRAWKEARNPFDFILGADEALCFVVDLSARPAERQRAAGRRELRYGRSAVGPHG